jgi:hypothetical protein
MRPKPEQFHLVLVGAKQLDSVSMVVSSVSVLNHKMFAQQGFPLHKISRNETLDIFWLSAWIWRSQCPFSNPIK